MRTTTRYSSLMSKKVVSSTSQLKRVSRNLVSLRRARLKERFGPRLLPDKSWLKRLSDVPGLRQAINVETKMVIT